MGNLNKNIVANIAGNLWIGILTLITTPLQINFLGIEAYGLIGFIATIQIIAIALDLGLSTTITRELASDSSSYFSATQPLIRTALTFYWVTAVFVGIGAYSFSEYIANDWFKESLLGSEVISTAIKIVAIILALRWPVAFYTGVFAGVNRIGALNVIKVIVATFRLLGGIFVLIIWKDLIFLLTWTLLSAFIEVIIYAYVIKKLEPSFDWHFGFSWAAISSVWRFSLTIGFLALFALGITQIDRIFLSRMLPIEELGYYAVACAATSAISLILGSISNVLMPSYALDSRDGVNQKLLDKYSYITRGTLFFTGTLCFPLFFFGEEILKWWINKDVASKIWLPLALLALGFWFSGAVSNAYNICIAFRRPILMLKISIKSLILYIPILYYLIDHFGILGAASATLGLHISYLFVIIIVTHDEILKTSYFPIFIKDIIPFALLGLSTYGSARILTFIYPSTGWLDILMIACSSLLYFFIGIRMIGNNFADRIYSKINILFKIK